MREIIKRKSAEEICNHRDEALRLLKAGLELLDQAQAEAGKATNKNASYWVSSALQRHRFNDGDTHAIRAGRKTIDADVWRNIFRVTGLGDKFDTEHRRKFEEQLGKDPLEVTIENIIATSLDLAGRQGEIFTNSIKNLFKRLSRYHKSNSGFCFGSRLIFGDILSYHSMMWKDTIRDLERAVLTIEGVEVPSYNNGIIAQFSQERKGIYEAMAGEVENDHFDFRWFKNGNL